MLIKGGKVYDPLNKVRGKIQDIYIDQGKVVANASREETIDAEGLIIMPGGVDIHSHIAGPSVNYGRLICLGELDHNMPSSFATGCQYGSLGYTTVINAAVAALDARHTHWELSHIPVLDKANLILVGNNHFALELIKDGEREKLKDYLAWLLGATGGYGLKAVNPGGSVNWKHRLGIKGLDDQVVDYNLTPRKIIDALLEANEALNLPHALHLHCNNLGRPGGDRTIVDTIKLAAGRRLHLTHAQFYCYGIKPGLPFVSAAETIAQAVNDNPALTLDVGQIVFGPAVTISADMAFEHELHKMDQKQHWVNRELELEAGFGVLPMEYRSKTYVGATQWLIGLELFLLIANPWQVFLTTDHPNGGPFTAYPQIIRLLMDKDYRREAALQVNKKALQNSCLLDLKREYDLNEIAIITRAGTARALGLKHKGHLGIGADADITIYKWQENYAEMFSKPVYVLKNGVVVVRDGKMVADEPGKTICLNLPGRDKIESWLKPRFTEKYSMAYENFILSEQFLTRKGCIYST